MALAPTIVELLFDLKLEKTIGLVLGARLFLGIPRLIVMLRYVHTNSVRLGYSNSPFYESQKRYLLASLMILGFSK